VTGPHSRTTRWPLLAIGGALLALVVLGLVLAGIAASPPPPGGSGGYVVPTTPATASAPAIVPTPLPVAVRIPRLGVASDLIETGIAPDGTAEVPPVDRPLVASWMTVSPRPGDTGPAVLLGHVDGGGQAGVFQRLGELRPGDEILVDRDQAPAARFEVYRVQAMPKDAFDAELVYGDTPGAELRAITCSGAFDRSSGHYLDNTIVFARLATEASA
jgi:hypothetical protein